MCVICASIGRTYVFYLKNQQTCNSNNHNYTRRALLFNPILLMLHRRYANATHILLSKLVEVGENEEQT